MLNKFQSPTDIAFSLFGFDIYFYGIIMAFAILIGFITAYLLYKNFYNKNADFILDYSPILILIGILGARLYYCAVNFSYYAQRPYEIFDIRQGGLSIHGMLIFGIGALFIFAKCKKLSFLKLADVYLCASLLAQSIGRWGNFFNSEAYGYPTDLPWKLFIPISKRTFDYINFEYFHPTFLYESILDLAAFIVLVVLFKRFNKYSGLIACTYLILYSIIRIFVEHFRIDSVLYIFNIPIAQIISILLFIFGTFGIIFILKGNKIRE